MRKKVTEPRVAVGVIILMLSNIVVKVIGVLFKIPLRNLLGGEGMGYFDASYNIFTNLYLISTAGLPTAISIMVSRARKNGRKQEANRIFYASLTLFCLIGAFCTSVMFFGSDLLASWTGSPDAGTAIAVISPTLFLICISSVIRGYFQGHQNMLPTALSEVIESLGKFVIGIVMGTWAFGEGKSLEICAAYAIAGVAIGEAAGMILLIFAKLFFKPDYSYSGIADDGVTTPWLSVWEKLLKISVPIMISSVALNLTSTIDNFTIVNMMKSYVSDPSLAVSAYGNYSSLVFPLFHLPSAFIYPISTSIAPAISSDKTSDHEKKKIAETVTASIKMASVISVPCVFGMAILSKPILSLLFSDEAAINEFAPLLSIVSPAIFFSAILTVTSAILQARGYQKKPMISMACGIAVKAIVSVVLLGIPSVGIYGAPIGTMASYFVMAAINFAFVIKYVMPEINLFRIISKPLAASVAGSVITIFVYNLIRGFGRPNVGTLASVIATVIVYAIFLFLFREFTESDILILPKGKKIYDLLCKIKLMKRESDK